MQVKTKMNSNIKPTVFVENTNYILYHRTKIEYLFETLGFKIITHYQNADFIIVAVSFRDLVEQPEFIEEYIHNTYGIKFDRVCVLAIYKGFNDIVLPVMKFSYAVHVVVYNAKNRRTFFKTGVFNPFTLLDKQRYNKYAEKFL